MNEYSVILNSENYGICLTFLGSMTERMISKNLNYKNKHNYFISDSMFEFYYEMFSHNSKIEKITDEFVKLNFELDYYLIDEVTGYLSSLSTDDFEFFLKEMRIEYFTPNEVMEALVELILVLRIAIND